MKRLAAPMLLTLLWGCSEVGPGLKNHPVDCAVGVAWADCQPGTPGYRGTPAQLQYQGVFKRQEEAATSRKQRLDAAFSEARKCAEKRQAGELRTQTEAAACVNDALERGYAETDFPHLDLIYSLSASRIRVAEQIDKHEITDAEGTVRVAEKTSAVISEEKRRDAEAASATAAITGARAQAQAAAAQADAIRQQSALELMRLGSSMMNSGAASSPGVITTDCSRLGSMVHCTTR